MTVQLLVTDLRRSISPAQRDLRLYRRYVAGEALERWELEQLLPERRNFVALWRYLARAGEAGLVEAGVGGSTVRETTRGRVPHEQLAGIEERGHARERALRHRAGVGESLPGMRVYFCFGQPPSARSFSSVVSGSMRR